MGDSLDLKNALALAMLSKLRASKHRKTPRERLAERLNDAGYHVATHQIQGAKGFWRQEQFLDDTTLCWEAVVRFHPHDYPFPVSLYSYDTMTACARNGIIISELEDGGVCWVYAKQKKKRQLRPPERRG